MKKEKHLKRIMNVLPFRLKWLLIKNNYNGYIDPETIDKFFNWYMNEKRICLFMDCTIKPITSGKYNITDINYELQGIGSYFSYTLINKVDNNERINYSVRIKNNTIIIIRKATKDNFKKKYMVNILEENMITSETDNVLFKSLKDLMYNSLLVKLDVVYGKEYKKEDIYEAIPCWIK